MSAPALPDGFRVRVRDDVVRAGEMLVGGSPMTGLRLSATARKLLGAGDLAVTDATSAALAGRLLAANVADPVLGVADRVDAADLTVVIPVKDRIAQLDAALTSLQGLRILVVDDGSDDPAAVERVARRHGADHLALAVNQGPAAARNAGLAKVTTTFVGFVDSDVRATAEALLALTEHFADPSVVLVGPLVQGRVVSDRPSWFERLDAASSSLSLGHRGCVVRPGAAVAWLPSACLVARVDALGDGFSDEMRVGEDVDLVWRLVAAGHRVRYEPGVVVHHDVRTSVRTWLGRKVLYGSGGAPLAARHGANTAVAVLSPESALAAAALLLRRRWSVPIAAALSVRGWRRMRRALPSPMPERLSVEGAWWAVRQESALLLRHWWPLTALALPFSRSVRRATVTALVVDAVVVLRERPDVGLVGALVARRLDDLAYGAGLWWGCLRARSFTAVGVRRTP